MKHHLITVLLLAVITALLIPVIADIFASEQAFTSDNLVMLPMQFN